MNTKQSLEARRNDSILNPRQKDALDYAEDPSRYNPVQTLRAVQRLINEFFNDRYLPAVDTLADLRLIPADTRPDRTVCFVEDDTTPEYNGQYRYDADSTETEDLPFYVIPYDSVGRWIQVTRGISKHNAFGGLQGGLTDERYHLPKAVYDANAGTKGTPSSTNKFVTNADFLNLRRIDFVADGFLRAVSGIDPQKVLSDRTAAKLIFYREIAGSSGATEIDILKNGTTIFNPGNKPKIDFSAGNDAQVEFTPDVTALTAGSKVELKITTVEVDAWNLRASLLME